MPVSQGHDIRSFCFLFFALSCSLLLSLQATSNTFAHANAQVLVHDRRRSRHGFHSLESVFVINLESRKDRLHQITQVLGSLGLGGVGATAATTTSSPKTKYKIVNGIPHTCGILGCGLSHALAMIGCIDSGAAVCAIFEDDFELLVESEDAHAAIERFLQNQPASWEVLMLSINPFTPNIPSAEFRHLEVITKALTASGYLVHRSFAPTLLRTFLQAAYHLNKSNCSQAEYAHDVLWMELQRSGKWFALKPVIGKQRASYSDIQKKHVDYNVKR